MPRGKASVQHEHDHHDVLSRVLDRPTEIQVAPCNGAAGDANGASPLAAHLVDQLRVAYDELLNEPVPAHLQKLLDDLCKAEDDS